MTIARTIMTIVRTTITIGRVDMTIGRTSPTGYEPASLSALTQMFRYRTLCE